jgi:hypothetical protein
VGFTDVVKRPSASSSETSKDEFEFGRPHLMKRLEDCGANLVVFSFKLAAAKIIGPFDGCGFVPTSQFGWADVFVMPGPYAARGLVDAKLIELRRHVG